MGIRFEITKERPEDQPAALGLRLASELTAKERAEDDRLAFQKQSAQENKKAVALQRTIKEVEKYRENPPEKVSRMDPYMTYDLDACENELQTYLTRCDEFQEMADDCVKKIDKHQEEIDSLQKQLIVANGLPH